MQNLVVSKPSSQDPKRNDAARTSGGRGFTPKGARALDRGAIEEKALSYLNRFDASATRLERVLRTFVKQRAKDLGVEADPFLSAVTDILVRYRQNGLLDDTRYATTMARSLVERGVSRQAVKAKLHQRGISGDVVQAVVGQLAEEGGSELDAARALVRKRKLGKLRPEADRREHFKRDLGVLARAGFDFDTAKRALAVEGAEEEDF
jgi:regulatory protein